MVLTAPGETHFCLGLFRFKSRHSKKETPASEGGATKANSGDEGQAKDIG